MKKIKISVFYCYYLAALHLHKLYPLTVFTLGKCLPEMQRLFSRRD